MEPRSISHERVDALPGNQDGSSGGKYSSRGMKSKLAKGATSLKPTKQGDSKKEKTKPSPKAMRAFGCGGSRDNREDCEVEERSRKGVESTRSKVRTIEETESLHGQSRIASVNVRHDKQPTLRSKSSNVPSKTGMPETSSRPPSGSLSFGGGSSIPKPTAAVKGTSKSTKDDRQISSPAKCLPQKMQTTDMTTRQSGGTVSIALVSPMPNESHHNTIQKHSTPEPVKYGPKRIETTFDNLDKVITCEAQRSQPRETTFGEEDASMNVKPMRPLSRGFSGGLVYSGSPVVAAALYERSRKFMGNPKHIENHEIKRGIGDGGYGDVDFNMLAGYMSDGEACRERPTSDLSDGYMSEGGAPLFSRRFHSQHNYPDIRCSDLSSIAENKGELILRRPSSRHGPRSRNEEHSTPPATTEASNTDPLNSPSHRKIVQTQPASSDRVHSVPKSVSSYSPSETPQVIYRVVGTRSHVKKADSSQQTDNSAFRQHTSSGNQWKKNGETGRIPELHRGGKTEPELAKAKDKRGGPPVNVGSNGPARRTDRPPAERSKKMGVKDDANASGARDRELCNGDTFKPPKNDHSSPRPNGDSKGKVRGVPQSFGYVKRPTGTSTGNKGEPRTAQVSAVPRTKLKVSGGTQTCPGDLPPHHFKSYSLTSPAASQLSQNVRERLLLGSQSLPKPGDYAAFLHQHGRKPTDGSLSDTTYSNYAEVRGYYSGNGPYGSWLRHSATYTSSLPTRANSGLVEADSIESLCSLPAQLQHRTSLTHTRLLSQREGSASPGPRLNRSSSIRLNDCPASPRSTKSEKTYPSMLRRSEEVDPYYTIPACSPAIAHTANHQQHSSQPTSPTPSQVSQGTSSRFNNPVSPIASSASSHGLSRVGMTSYTGILSKTNSKEEDDVHGSAASLVSTASSLYSTAEEKQAHEIRKLRRELQDAQEKVHTLTNQLSTNAHVVSAFEQSLSNMTHRLQQLTSTAEKKDSELLELRQTIELLRKQSVEAGLTSAHIQNMSPSMTRRHTINTSETNNGNMSRQLSADSVSSINSLSSVCSLSSSPQVLDSSISSAKKKKRGWLRSSFSKAFSRSKKNRNGSVSDVEDFRGLHSDISAPSSPLLSTPHHISDGVPIKNSQSASAVENMPCNGEDTQVKYDEDKEPDVVEELKKQLREKDLVLTDIRLEALSSAHQLESLKETVIKMRNEMLNLKQDNERLQRIVTSKSLTSSQSSLPMTDGPERRFSMTDASVALASSELDGKHVFLSVYLGCHGSYEKYLEENGSQPECIIASLSLSPKTKWDLLDCLVRRLFKEYVLRVDPVANLGLSAESIWSYHVGEVVRFKDSPPPELLPYGYFIGEEQNIHICLKGTSQTCSVDALAFETLIPKSIMQRYISLLTEHRRIILCGPSGTGKSYLANKLAEFLVLRDGKESTAESVATFNVDHKSSKELRQYLGNVAEQCENSASDLPSVIILDNLHHAASLGEVFNGFLNTKYSKCPYIIGTMNQATCSTTNLQLHHNFRWVLCANHMEPVKGFLGRYLRRRLVETEVRRSVRNNDLARVFDWIPRVWQHLNKFLETHSSSDVTIGPRLFLSCPSELDGSQVWFTDLWNYSLVPYLLEAVREGLQLYGRRAPWEDPTVFISQTYPWTTDTVPGGHEALLRLRPEDVGYDSQQSGSSLKNLSSAQSDTDGDPLLNMLMRLQEAANYSSPHSNDSDSLSLDSHTEEKPSSRVESTL